MPLMLRTISVTSSLTPGIVENSCSTPSILIDVTATTRQRGQQHPPQAVAQRDAEAALQRLYDELAVGSVGGKVFSASILGFSISII